VQILVSYYVQATLVTIFTIALTIEYIFITRNRQPSWFTHKNTKKLRDALSASLPIFVDSNQLFCLAFIIASIWAAIPPPVTQSQLILSNDMAFFTLTTVNSLNILSMFAFGDRAESRTGVFLILLALCVISAMLTTIMKPKAQLTIWELDCGMALFSKERLTTRILYGLYVGLSFIVAIIFSILPRILKNGEGALALRFNTWTQKNKRWGYVLFTVVFGLAMWGYLINVTATRQRILTASGGSNEDGKWTFGQVVALCTWIPVLVEVFYLMKSKLLPLIMKLLT
jgi:hypothetical protein